MSAVKTPASSIPVPMLDVTRENKRLQGQIDAAIASWRKAVALDATNFDALYNLCIVLLAADRAGEARPHVEQFVRTAPRGVYGREIAEFRKWLQ